MRGNCQQRKGNKRRREEKGKENYLKTVSSFIDIHPKFFSLSIHIFFGIGYERNAGKDVEVVQKRAVLLF